MFRVTASAILYAFSLVHDAGVKTTIGREAFQDLLVAIKALEFRRTCAERVAGRALGEPSKGAVGCGEWAG